jgi:hypothetical protein
MASPTGGSSARISSGAWATVTASILKALKGFQPATGIPPGAHDRARHLVGVQQHHPARRRRWPGSGWSDRTTAPGLGPPGGLWKRLPAGQTPAKRCFQTATTSAGVTAVPARRMR